MSFSPRTRTLAGLGALALAVSALGCGADGPPHYPLSGRVVLDGTPLSPKPGETAFVELAADATTGNTSPHLPRGAIAPDGTYTVSTANRPGIEAGAWRARVVYQREPQAEDKRPYAPPVALVGRKFTVFETSGFRVTAGPDAPTAPDLVVSKAP